MTYAVLEKEIKKLSVNDRLNLISDIWDDLAEHQPDKVHSLVPNAELERELQDRYQDYIDNPDEGNFTPDEVRAEFRRRLKEKNVW